MHVTMTLSTQKGFSALPACPVFASVQTKTHAAGMLAIAWSTCVAAAFLLLEPVPHTTTER